MGSIKVIGFIPAKKPAPNQNQVLSKQQIEKIANAFAEAIAEHFPELEDMDEEDLEDWLNQEIDD
ncbi:hypothetical protein QNI19_26710 [Cytophagaceae bacterium DM2B3-1]|uniref:DUF2281 domain-containing protein n=1 Tax=Xanthocytophaga flava TaxID=3048013 RepID=A0ABT7CS43_9BACT|nr:hypothetical protein [Xanthocytophaga flavus]MDJ1496553.1 hypothetical protein [Xanthocytophaga flavus]